MRIVTKIGLVLVVLASALIAPITGSSPTATASAADLSYFDPGNIISDAVFFDALATDVGGVQDFLNAKGASCVAGEQACLKDYRQTTATQPGDAYCSTYPGAANETAASIIVKVGRACGINPRVLVVLLQKEQGLVTGTRPATVRYTKATGFACPDTAACNPEFSGFASQVYFAARQFDRYAAGVAGSYRAGRNNTVLYNPNSACGSSQVFIQNKATAGLYSYTPYQPNAAALAAGYGTGDSCSAYGNRNFWNYFTDWFGSTQSTGGGYIYTYWQSVGAASSWLGPQASALICGLRYGGCFQQFQGGSVYWSQPSGVYSVGGIVGARWADLGYETKFLGYPTGDQICGLTGGGCVQWFQGGAIYWSYATGAKYVIGAILGSFSGAGYEGGSLGYPTTDEMCGLTGGGCAQGFQRGAIYYSPATGAYPIPDQIMTGWARTGRENGPLGYPTSGQICGLTASGCIQFFQNGNVYFSPASGSASVRGDLLASYATAGYEGSSVGYPVSDQICGLAGGGCGQGFQRGAIYWSPASGGFPITDVMMAGWARAGRETGTLGYPTAAAVCGLAQGGCGQTYQTGVQFGTSSTGMHFLHIALVDTWKAAGGEGGYLGYPTADQTCQLVRGGCVAPFQGGAIFWSPTTGPQAVGGAILDTWTAQGRESGRWGYPARYAVQSGTTVVQQFENGTATWDLSTGGVTFR